MTTQDTESLDSLMLTCVDVIFAMVAVAFFAVSGAIAYLIGAFQ